MFNLDSSSRIVGLVGYRGYIFELFGQDHWIGIIGCVGGRLNIALIKIGIIASSIEGYVKLLHRIGIDGLQCKWMILAIAIINRGISLSAKLVYYSSEWVILAVFISLASLHSIVVYILAIVMTI